MVYQLRIILKRARIFQMNQPYGQIRDSGVGVCVLSPLQLCRYDVCTLGDFCGQLLLALLQLRPLDGPVGPKWFSEAGSSGRAFPFSVFVCLLFT